MSYKKIVSAWLNDSKNGDGKYLSVKNVSDEEIIIKPGESLFLNMTPKNIRDKNPSVPMFSKSVKVDENEDVSDDVPF